MQLKHMSFIGVLVFSIILVVGCSGGNNSSAFNPITPSMISGSANSSDSADAVKHSLLGLYSCLVSESGIEILPLRDTMFHLNALRFLEPPPPVRLQISNFEFDGEIVDVDVQFIHPFQGLNQFTGFDVCGIVISSGSYSGFSDPDIVVAVEGDTRLINPDGLTRWWNPGEFPYNETVPMWGYINGGFGTSDEFADYTATLNGYKYHADGLTVNDDLTVLDPAMRGAFSAGSGHTRHYTIDMDGGFVFNYAVDATWLPPEGDPPVVVPDDFPPSANRDEPYFMQIDVVDNTLFFDPSTGSGGGDLILNVDCYDWFDADLLNVRAESPGVFIPATSDIPIGGGAAYSTYEVELSNPEIYSDDPVTIWVSAEAGMDYEGFVPGKATSAFMAPFDVEVSTLTTSEPELVLVWRDEGNVEHSADQYGEAEPALVISGDGELLLAFNHYIGDEGGPVVNYPRYISSWDNGHTFGSLDKGYWNSMSVNVFWLIWNNKFTVGPDGQPYNSFGSPPGHALHVMPWGGTYPDENGGSHSGPKMEHAGEMLYTIDGYPMMFGDKFDDNTYGSIWMRRGDIPNIPGTGTWPFYIGTEFVLESGSDGAYVWCSLSRSTGKTSDGICHFLFWGDANPYIRMMSSSDTSGEDWQDSITVYGGYEEIWVGAQDPGMWIDDDDTFHVVFAGETFTGEFMLMYGTSDAYVEWTDNFDNIGEFSAADGLRDTQVVVFDAFDETWVFLSYESGGNVYCMYKNIDDDEFSDPILVNEAVDCLVPDIYPNGDVGVMYAYDAESGQGDRDVYWRLAEWELQ